MNYLKLAKNFRAKKSLGQNFLIDEEVINFIVDTAKPDKDKTLLEIGSGPGFITQLLAEKAKKVISIEIDPYMVNYLNELNLENLQVVQKDILKVNFPDFVESTVTVVANIPYYITTPILIHLIGEVDEQENQNRKLIDEIIIMVQKEVATRIIATNESANKEFGALSIAINFWCEPEILKIVKARSFWPAPKVDSAILRLKIRPKPEFDVHNFKTFKKVVRTSFNFRRKTLKNALILNGFSDNIVREAIKTLSLQENIRGEKLSLEQFVLLSNVIFRLSQEQNNPCQP